MKWFDKLERKYSKYAIKNLMYYIIILYAIGLVIEVFAPQVYSTYLALDARAILHGQIWRIFTFIIEPPSSSLIFMVFVLYFYYMIGSVLEQIWGAFRFNVYFFSGVILNVIAAIVVYLATGIVMNMSTYYINLALFMSFAMEQPDMEVLVFFVLPVKIKWMAWLDGALFVFTIIGGYFASMLSPTLILRIYYSIGIVLNPAIATTALISMINFLIFLFIYKKGPAHTATQKNFRKAYKTAAKAEKKRKASYSERFYNANAEKSTWAGANEAASGVNSRFTGKTKHKCAVCGRTELDGDDLTFRFCSKCAGSMEYCQDHLYTHVHVSSEDKDEKNVINIIK